MIANDCRVRVWAPAASKVELITGNQRHAMLETGGGWWCSDFVSSPDSDYSFSLDGATPLPDPRSEFQPYGVHGPSRIVDHAVFNWTDANWRGKPWREAVVYELHIGTFTPEGTFDAAIAHLGHLTDLGFTHVELMPVAEFSGDWGWGYDGVDLFAPHFVYGGPDGLKRFVNACHERGLAVLLDVVYNHFGPSGNYWNRFGPYTSERHHTPWGAAVNLDGPDSYEVRRFFCDNALMWLRDYHMDGLRLDAVHTLIDTSPVHFIQQLTSEVDALELQLDRPLVIIGESDLNDVRIVQDRKAGGLGLDAQWSDDFHHALHVLLTGEASGYYADFAGFSALAKAITGAFVYDGAFSVYRNRAHGTSAAGVAPDRFLIYAQTHDQVGNRAVGERTSHLLNPTRLKIAAALPLLLPYVPMIFQGEEWGASTPFLYFSNHREDWLATAVSKGRQSEFNAFGWRPEDVPDPQDPATFERSKLNWSEIATDPHHEIIDWYCHMIGLRKHIPPDAPVKVDFDEHERWMQIERGPLKMRFTLSPDAIDITCDTIQFHA